MSIEFYLKKRLEHFCHPNDDRIEKLMEESIEKFKNNIKYFAENPLLKKYSAKADDIAKPWPLRSNCSYIAKVSSIYFKQGYELLKASQTMDDNTSPLVEYYGFVQIIKGVINLDLEIIDQDMFSKHGLVYLKTTSNYINADIKFYGILSSFILRHGDTKKWISIIQVIVFLQLKKLFVSIIQKVLENI